MNRTYRGDSARGFCCSGIAVLAMTLSSCALVSSYVSDSGVAIEKISTGSARIVSAGFWLDGDRLSLRGEVVSNPVSKSPLRGHLDIEIVEPDQAAATCLTTGTRTGARQVRKRYSLPLTSLPAPGSTLRIWHDRLSKHVSCASSRPPTNLRGGSSV